MYIHLQLQIMNRIVLNIISMYSDIRKKILLILKNSTQYTTYLLTYLPQFNFVILVKL